MAWACFRKGAQLNLETGLTSGYFISRLPEDILRMLFGCISESTESDSLSRIDAAITLSHVSSGWRAIAVDCPALWVAVTNARADLIPLQIERSRDLPLKLFWKSNSEQLPNSTVSLLSILDEHSQRLRALSINLLKHDLDEVIGLLSDHPSPSLILLDVAYDDTVEGDDQLDTNYYLDDSFLSHFPGIKRLRLSNIAVRWAELVIDSPFLTHLDVSNRTAVSHFSGVSLVAFLELLARFPQLEFLKLDWNCMAALRSQPPLQEADLLPLQSKYTETNQFLALSQLRVIDVTLPDLQSAVELSRSISVHPDCRVTYTTQKEESGTNDSFPLPLLLKNIFPRNSLPHALRSLEVTSSFPFNSVVGELSFLGIPYNDESQRNDTEDSELSTVGLKVGGVPCAGHTEFLRVACELFDLSSVLELKADLSPASLVPSDVESSLWHSLGRRCSSVENLTLSHSSIETFASAHEALSDSYSDSRDDSGPPKSMHFPALGSLSLVGQAWLDADVEARLVDVLKWRKERGYGLKMVVIEVRREGFDWDDCAEIKVTDKTQT